MDEMALIFEITLLFGVDFPALWINQ